MQQTPCSSSDLVAMTTLATSWRMLLKPERGPHMLGR